MKINPPATILIICLIIMIALTILGLFTVDGAEDAANQYCEMVYNGHWPDYQQNYDKFCDKDKWNGK